MIQHPKEGKVLLVKRKIQDEWFYEPIGGQVEVNFLDQKAETLEECVQREAIEETDLRIQRLQYVGRYYFFGFNIQIPVLYVRYLLPLLKRHWTSVKRCSKNSAMRCTLCGVLYKTSMHIRFGLIRVTWVSTFNDNTYFLN